MTINTNELDQNYPVITLGVGIIKNDGYDYPELDDENESDDQCEPNVFDPDTEGQSEFNFWKNYSIL